MDMKIVRNGLSKLKRVSRRRKMNIGDPLPVREVPRPFREPIREPQREPRREPAREPVREPVKEPAKTDSFLETLDQLYNYGNLPSSCKCGLPLQSVETDYGIGKACRKHGLIRC